MISFNFLSLKNILINHYLLIKIISIPIVSKSLKKIICLTPPHSIRLLKHTYGVTSCDQRCLKSKYQWKMKI